MYKFKTIGQKEEIKIILSIGLNLLNNDGLLYVLDSHYLTGKDVIESYYNKDYSFIKRKILLNILGSTFFNERMSLYSQIDIFKPLLPIIEAAIKSFKNKNYIASYMTLVPVIEGLIRRWNIKNEFSNKINNCDNRKCNRIVPFIFKVTNAKYLNNKTDYWTIHNLIMMRKMLCYFTKNTNKCNQKEELNRHLVAHLINDISPEKSFLNTLKLFNFIDLIAFVLK